MKYKTYIEVELLVDDIDEIVNRFLCYLFNNESINDIEGLYFAIKSIPEKITELKKIMETELIENESYFESQDESKDF